MVTVEKQMKLLFCGCCLVCSIFGMIVGLVFIFMGITHERESRYAVYEADV